MSRLALRMSGPIPESTHAKIEYQYSLRVNSMLSHQTAIRNTLEYVHLVSSSPTLSDDDLIAKLTAGGLSETDAEKLIVFVPAAFGWALLQKAGVRNFPGTYVLLPADGSRRSRALATEHYFTAALALATETLSVGWSEDLTRAAFEVVVARSAELGAANKLLAGDQPLAAAQVSPFVVFGFDWP